MGLIESFPGTAPAPAVMHILGRLDRPTLEAFLSAAIDLLDTMDGDPDTEDDDPSGQCDEDGVNTDQGSVRRAYGAGCKISDPGGDWANEDQPEGYQTQSTSGAGPGCPLSDPGGTAGLDC